MFYFRFLFSLSLCFLYLSSDVVCLRRGSVLCVAPTRAGGGGRRVSILVMMFVMFVMLLRRARAIHAMKRKRFCISLYLVSFQRERMRFEFDMVVFLLRALTVFTAPQFLSVSVRRHSIRCRRPNRPLSHTQIIFIQGNP